MIARLSGDERRRQGWIIHRIKKRFWRSRAFIRVLHFDKWNLNNRSVEIGTGRRHTTYVCMRARRYRAASLVHRKQNYTIPNALPLISVTSCRRDGCTCARFYFSVSPTKCFRAPKTNCGLLIEIHRTDDSGCSKTFSRLPAIPRLNFAACIFGVIFPDKSANAIWRLYLKTLLFQLILILVASIIFMIV